MLPTLLVFIFVLGILVLVHELGHFIMAKKMGIKVEEFGFGLPPRLWGRKIGETVYSLNWLPIGGFVRLYGEDGEDSSEFLRERAFFAKKPWERAAVLLAGVLMNFLLGWAIISFVFTQGVMVPTERVRVEKVLEGSPAQASGLREGDIIRKMKIPNPKSQTEFEIKSPKDLVEITKEHLGEEIVLEIQREKKAKTQQTAVPRVLADFETLEMKIIPRKEAPEGEGPMGVVITNFEEKVYPWYQAPFLGFSESFRLSWQLLSGVGQTLWKLLTFQSVRQEVAGPLGIAQLTGEAVKFGKLAVLEFLGLLSINLAVINILPFPALDGGRLLFVGIEGLTGRKVRPRWEKYLHQAGMAILLALILLVTVNDLLRILR